MIFEAEGLTLAWLAFNYWAIGYRCGTVLNWLFLEAPILFLTWNATNFCQREDACLSLLSGDQHGFSRFRTLYAQHIFNGCKQNPMYRYKAFISFGALPIFYTLGTSSTKMIILMMPLPIIPFWVLLIVSYGMDTRIYSLPWTQNLSFTVREKIITLISSVSGSNI